MSNMQGQKDVHAPSPRPLASSGRELRQRRPRVKNPKLLKEIVRAIGRCEWPHGCRFPISDTWNPLDPAHIKPRGQQGDDSWDNVAVLCRRHHDAFDHQMGQSRKNQEWLREAVQRLRKERGHDADPNRPGDAVLGDRDSSVADAPSVQPVADDDPQQTRF